MKRYAWAALDLLALLTACPGRRKVAGPGPDYGATKQHAQESQQSMDREKTPGGE